MRSVPSFAALILLSAAALAACGSDETVERPAGGGGKAGSAGGAGTGGGAGGGAGSAGKSGTAGAAGASAGAAGMGIAGGAGASGAAGGASGASGSGASGQSGQAGIAGAGGIGVGGKGGSGGAAGSAGGGGAAAGSSGSSGGSGASGNAGSAAGSAGASAGSAGAAGGGCVPTEANETTCNGIDDDCDGRVDDVDIAKDGFCDCLRIGILGGPGSKPSANFAKWLTDKGTTVTRFGVDGGGTLDAATLAPHDVLVVDRLARDYTAEEAAAFTKWVEKGGGFVTMTGYTANVSIDWRANALLSSFGLSYTGPLLSGPVDTFAMHPVTTGLTSVTFAGGFEVGLSPSQTIGSSTLIGSFGGKKVAYAHERQSGRGVVWGDEWIQFDSEWTTQPEIKELWENMMSWVSPRTKCELIKD